MFTRAFVLLVLAGLYYPVLAQMMQIWLTHQYAGHGIFVPLFSAVLLWMERDRLRTVPRTEDRTGLAVIFLGVGVLALGYWTDSLLIEGWSVVIAVAGAVLWCLGRQWLRVVAFPVGFLTLMVPLPRPLVDAVTLDLQLFAAGFSGWILRLLDIPVYLSGVVIELPTMTLEVAEICNGLRFLMALMVLTVAFAQVTQRGWLRKTALIVSAIPIAILANASRVAVIALAVHFIGPHAATGVIHHAIGKAVWALTLAPLIAVGFALSRGGRRSDYQPSPAIDEELHGVGEKLKADG